MAIYSFPAPPRHLTEREPPPMDRPSSIGPAAIFGRRLRVEQRRVAALLLWIRWMYGREAAEKASDYADRQQYE